MNMVSKAVVQGVANKINQQYEIGHTSYKVTIMDREGWDGRKGWIVNLEGTGIDAIEVSMLGSVDNYCRSKHVWTEPITSYLIGVYLR